MDYIHNNPVLAGLIDEPQHYRYSSARDYAGGKGLLDVTLVECAAWLALGSRKTSALFKPTRELTLRPSRNLAGTREEAKANLP